MNLNNIKNEAEKIRMTPEEKQTMHLRIFDTPSYAATPSTYFFYSFQFSARTLVPLFVVLVVLVGTGTAYAAQGSLPGDMLYPIKVHITEPVELVLARTPEDKTKVEVSIATRRVAEAEVLAAEGRLDATMTQEIESNFNEHAARALVLTGKKEGRATPTAASMRVQLAPAEQTATSSREKEGEDIEGDVSASLDEQKNILHSLKIQVRTNRLPIQQRTDTDE